MANAIEVSQRHEDLPALRAAPPVRHAEERHPQRDDDPRPAPRRDVPRAARRVVLVAAGRTYGIIGRNGSGKSTALKLVAGITKPTSGSVKVTGRISALIELGAGFHPEISGRENVYINGIMLGLSKREIARRFDEIVEFAELQDFIDAPVKTYSSGMYMRLGFAVAIHVDPDVLLVDEVLAVGDEGFTHKCLDKFGEFRRRGKTILLVTHSLGLVERFCDEVLWLDAGQARASGDPRRVVGMYVTDVERSEERQLARDDQRKREATDAAPAAEARGSGVPAPAVDATGTPQDMFQATEGRWGSREVEITDVTVLAADGQAGHVFQSGEPLSAAHDDPGRPARAPTSSSASASSTPTGSASTAPTPMSSSTCPSGSTAKARRGSPSTHWISSRAPTNSMSPCTSATATRTTTTGRSTRSG